MTSTDRGTLPHPSARGSPPVISTADLQRRLDDDALILVDVRPMAAYNGWQLKGEARGGHIRGAVAFPRAWLEMAGPDRLGPLLASKGILPDKTVVVYDDAPSDAATLAETLTARGFDEVYAYAGRLAEWAADPSLPMERLPRYEKLVHSGWVEQLIAGRRPATYAGNGFAVFHVNFGVPEEYAEGHLPGAVHLDTNALESARTWNRRSPAELEAALLAHGITADKTVVLYGRDTTGNANEKGPGRQTGQIAAFRAALILLYAGVRDVRILDGGYDGWVSSGHLVEAAPRRPTPAASFGVQIPAHPEYLIDLDEVKDLLADRSGAALASVRTWAEHVGDVSGYTYIGPRGRIPGSVWANYGSDAYHMETYRNIDNTMRSYPEIAANWSRNGITPGKRVSFYCGTGWRASEACFCAYLMGWPHISVYDGGWFEWSSDPANPVETGAPRPVN